MSSTPNQPFQYDALAESFGKKYGAFRCLLVGNLKTRLKNSAGFEYQGVYVTQSKKGALMANNWHKEAFDLSEKKPNKTQKKSSFLNFGERVQQTSRWILDQTEVSSDLSKSSDFNQNKTALRHQILPEFSSSYSYFLITGKLTPPDKFHGISKIPWLKVFDFDVDSKTNGLLSTVEDVWKTTRFISLSTCSSDAERKELELKSLSSDSTDWFFPLGYSDLANTVFDGKPLAWLKDNKTVLEKQVKDIGNFCVSKTEPVFLILWYDPEKNNVKYLDWLLTEICSDTLSKQIALCYDKTTCDNSSLQDIVMNYELGCTTFDISAEAVYKELAKQTFPTQTPQGVVMLPAFNNEIKTITETSWLLGIQRLIEILPLESQDAIASRKTQEFGKEFLKGSAISWDELSSGSKLAVRRDGKRDVWKYLETEVFKKQKSMVLRIQHAPGGGGTTFARQLLWDLHFRLPCIAVKPNLTLSIAQISEVIERLNDLTKLPVVLLIDGHSEFEIDQIYENCKYAVVILHVQRYIKKIPSNEFLVSSTTCRLPGRVTLKEAKQLTEVYSSFSPKSSKILGRFTSDVENNKERFVFEYGLAAFNHEFKGVRNYVQGYLKLHTQKYGLKNLLDWQRVIAYLSLALYYGGSGVHRQTFRGLLEVQNHVYLKHLDYSGSQFIIQSNGEWKISHDAVAKEILDQILSNCSSSSSESCVRELSAEAKTNLHEIVIDFIKMIEDASEGYSPESLIQLLTNMIIKRNLDYIEEDKSDEIITKAVHSKLLEDIPNHQNRIDILQQLTKAFPQNAEFHAHLGRLLNIMKKFREAEKSLQTALTIRKEEFLNLGSDFTKDVSLSRIHHMLGVGYSLRAEDERERADKDNYQCMLEYVKKAVEQFVEARRRTTHNLSYGCIGEIHARLILVEFVNNKFPEGCKGAVTFELGYKHIELSEFVQQSHSVCDRLLALSLQHSTEKELQHIGTYTKCIKKYNDFFGKMSHEMFRHFKKEKNPTILMQRSQIAGLKMNYRKGKVSKIPCIEDVQEKEDLQQIIELYESILRQVFAGGYKHESISVEMVEWLQAIRHPLAAVDRSLEQVLPFVTNWEKKKEPDRATFYLYVINFMLAVFSAGANLNMEYNKEALRLKEKLQQRCKREIARITTWRLEWIAHTKNVQINTSICKLINRDKLGDWDKEKRFWKDEKAMRKLQVFTGTVTKSKENLKGTIILDTFQPRYQLSIEVYFVPKAYNLNQSTYAEQKQRVEFCIGFSYKHGAEAFEVKKLQKHFCVYCSLETEFITHNEPPGGRCRTCGTTRPLTD